MKTRLGTPRRAEGDRLRVPEAGRGVDPAGGEGGDGVEADRDPVDAGRVAAVGAQLGVDHGFVGGQAGDADGPALEVAGAPDRAAARGDDRRQRPLDDRHRADDVEALLAGDPEVVDVEDREVDAAGGEQFRHRAGVAGLADLEVDAGVLVVAAALRRVDPGMDGVGREIEHQRRALGRARFSAAPAAGGAGERQDGRQQRDSRSHFAAKTYLVRESS